MVAHTLCSCRLENISIPGVLCKRNIQQTVQPNYLTLHYLGPIFLHATTKPSSFVIDAQFKDCSFAGGKVGHLPAFLDGQNKWEMASETPKKCIRDDNKVVLLHNIDRNWAALRMGPWKYIKCIVS